jgi:poly(A) polymerase
MARASDPQLARLGALRVVQRLREGGHVAYFAGGCVRDELLGLHPTDYDVATNAHPARVAQLLPGTHEVGASFGVVLAPQWLDRPGESGAHARHKVVIEVATFRTDGTYSDKRRPDRVVFADAPTDAQRRDFTINALFLDPLSDAAGADVRSPLGGVVIDHVGGVADLRAGVLRAVGDADARLAEDHLRALRAARFAARLGLTIEPGTADAIRRHASELAGVSRERIGEEVRRMLLHDRRADAAELLQSLGLDAPALQESTVARPARLLRSLDVSRLDPAWQLAGALGAWVLDRRGEQLEAGEVAPAVSRWRGALCLSNDESTSLRSVLESWVLIGQWQRAPQGGAGAWPVAREKRLLAQPATEVAQRLEPSDNRWIAGHVETRRQQLMNDGVGIDPVSCVNGADLQQIGLLPGPRFKKLLEQVYDAQLEGRVRGKAEGLELARRLSVET